jgi:hypothetical protein
METDSSVLILMRKREFLHGIYRSQDLVLVGYPAPIGGSRKIGEDASVNCGCSSFVSALLMAIAVSPVGPPIALPIAGGIIRIGTLLNCNASTYDFPEAVSLSRRPLT